MNHPETFDKFVLPTDVPKVTYHRDTKIRNAATFEIQREDHTVGEPIVSVLLEDEDVSFAACKVPHPLEYRLLIKIRTADNPQQGGYTPTDAYNKAVNQLSEKLQYIKDMFKQQVLDSCPSDPCIDFDPASKYAPLERVHDDYSMEAGADESMEFKD